MGVAVIFGLMFATALTLVVVPTMYHILTGFSEWVAEKFNRLKDTAVVEAETSS